MTGPYFSLRTANKWREKNPPKIEGARENLKNIKN